MCIRDRHYCWICSKPHGQRNCQRHFWRTSAGSYRCSRRQKPVSYTHLIKINHITDADIVEKLYEASSAGVQIDILLRGNCSLVPGIKGISENIKIIGIIDRYLEHSRILIFCNGGKPRYFLDVYKRQG